MINLIKPILQLIYPPYCLICNKAGDNLCPEYSNKWRQDVKRGYINNIPLYFTNFYDDICTRLILLAKENGNIIAQDLLAISLRNSLAAAISELKIDGEVALITIPSRTSSIRKRGRDHIALLANKVIAISNTKELSLRRLPILRITRKIEDQSNLNKLQRFKNISGSYLATQPDHPVKNLIILDDLITTGASIHEGIRALSEIKLRPVAIITACAVGAHL